jgi:hypothetical protein
MGIGDLMCLSCACGAGHAVSGAQCPNRISVAKKAASREDVEDLVLALVVMEGAQASPLGQPHMVDPQVPATGPHRRRQRLEMGPPMLPYQLNDFIDFVDIDQVRNQLFVLSHGVPRLQLDGYHRNHPPRPSVGTREVALTTRRRIIEGTWTCAECDTKGVRGRHKVCPNCGSPREKSESIFDFGQRRTDGSSVEATVADTDSLEKAKAGSDWICAYCGASNRGDQSSCTSCAGGKDAVVSSAASVPIASRKRARLRAHDWVDDLLVSFGIVGGLAGVGVVLTGGILVICVVLCVGVLAWVSMPIDSEATVSDRTYTREVTVERLKPAERTDWREDLPAETAQPPGSETLAPGLGAIQGCKTLSCWPRPPAGQGLARIRGKGWERVITTKKLVRRSGSGWDDKVPRSKGSMPIAGQGGSEGLYGSPSCRKKERKPKKCRTVSEQVACGQEEHCSINDLGNGFAEEVCTTSTKYCTERHEECEPAVRDDWCEWMTLKWAPGRKVQSSGTTNSPKWPSLLPASNERTERDGSYWFTLEALTHGAPTKYSVTSAESLARYEVGTQVFVGGGISGVPSHLVRKSKAHDCGQGIPRDLLTTRDRCDYTEWRWTRDPALTASSEDLPSWPDAVLGDDGREFRSEWADVTLFWTERKAGDQTFRVSLEEAGDWPVGRTVPIRIALGGDVTWPEEWPATSEPVETAPGL